MARIRVVPRPFRPTARQIEVLAYRCATGSRKDAAVALSITLGTVEQHLRLLLAGSHAADDAQLCLLFHDEIQPYLDH